MRRDAKLHKILLTAGIIVVVLALLYIAAGSIIYHISIDARSDKSFILNGNAHDNPALHTEIEKSEQKKDKEFLASHTPEDVYITSTDKLKLKLHGNVFRNSGDSNTQNNRWYIFVHGYGSNLVDNIRNDRKFFESGYNVLAPDLRGHGKSEGRYIGMGWDDRLDVCAWINWIVSENPNAKIIIMGVSMGAATVMNTSGESVPSNVKAFIEDCGFNSAGDIATYQVKKLLHMGKFPIVYAVRDSVKLHAGYDIFKSSAVKQLQKNKTPILFIHGTADNFVPYFMLDKVYNATSAPKEKLIVEGAGHCESSIVNAEVYWQTVLNFAEKHIND